MKETSLPWSCLPQDSARWIREHWSPDRVRQNLLIGETLGFLQKICGECEDFRTPTLIDQEDPRTGAPNVIVRIREAYGISGQYVRESPACPATNLCHLILGEALGESTLGKNCCLLQLEQYGRWLLGQELDPEFRESAGKIPYRVVLP